MAASPTNQSNQLLMKFWNNPKQQISGQKIVTTMQTVGRNAKPRGQHITYNQNNCDAANRETNELDVKIKDVRSPHRDFKQTNSCSNTNNVIIVHPPAPNEFGCDDDTYEDGIDKDMRDLERRLESELEEHEELWSPEEETPISHT